LQCACGTEKTRTKAPLFTVILTKYFDKLHGKELPSTHLDISAATEFDCRIRRADGCRSLNIPRVESALIPIFARRGTRRLLRTNKAVRRIIVCNRPLSEPLAKVIGEIFSEVIIAPDFEGEARGDPTEEKESSPHSIENTGRTSETGD